MSDDVRRVSVEEAAELLAAGFRHVDVRTELEFEAGHPAGAINVPLKHAGVQGMQDNPDFLETVQAVFSAEDPILLSCRAGARSSAAAKLLAAAGYVQVVDQRSGFDGCKDAFGQTIENGWKHSGQPIEAGEGEGSYASLRARYFARR